MNITDEAVEALAKRNLESELGDGEWDNVPEQVKPGWRKEARAQAEAVAPFIAAEAWEEGAVAGWKQSGEGWNFEYPDESTGECSVELTANPYALARQGT